MTGLQSPRPGTALSGPGRQSRTAGFQQGVTR